MNKLQLVLVIYLCCWVSKMGADQLTINGITFGEMWTYFTGVGYSVTSMEIDLYHSEHLLYSDDCAVKVLDMRSLKSYAIAGDSGDCGYKEGVGLEARFDKITDIKNLNQTHILVADSDNHCLRLIDCLSNRTSTYAGKCTDAGNRVGSLLEARFDDPYKIAIKPNTSIIYMCENVSIRKIDTEEQQVSRLLYLGYFPTSMVMDSLSANIYVSSHSKLSKVNVETEEMTDLTSSFIKDFQDGPLNIAKFDYISQTIFLNPETLLAVDLGNRRIRIIDLANSLVTSICNGNYDFRHDGNLLHCQMRYPESAVVLEDQSTILIGDLYSIRGINTTGIPQSNYSTVRFTPQPVPPTPPVRLPKLTPPQTSPPQTATVLLQTLSQPQPNASTIVTNDSPVWIIAVSVVVSIVAVMVVGAMAIIIYKKRRSCQGWFCADKSGPARSLKNQAMTTNITPGSQQNGDKSQDDDSAYDCVYTSDVDAGYIIPLADKVTPKPPTSARPPRPGDICAQSSSDYYSYAVAPNRQDFEVDVSVAVFHKYGTKEDTSGYVDIIETAPKVGNKPSTTGQYKTTEDVNDKKGKDQSENVTNVELSEKQ